MKLLEKKTAAITGAGSGIGRAIALTLAKAGSRVAVSDIRAEWSEQVAKEIGTAGGVALAVKLDVTRKQEAEEAVARIVKKWGRLDIWVNNAGVSTMNRFLELSEKERD